MLEGDSWRVFVVFVVVFDVFLFAFRSESAALPALSIAISFFFFVEICARLYLW